jgi:DNA (cytosine-5)-methyltransferase 1
MNALNHFAKKTLFGEEFDIRYSYLGSEIRRTVQLSDGVEVTSTVVPLVESTGDASSDFDLAWLMSNARPIDSNGPPVTVVDLFAGCGGFSVGVDEAARSLGRTGRSLGAVDFEKGQAATYSRNFKGADVRCCDVNEVLPGAVGDEVPGSVLLDVDSWRNPDFIIGGPPCQGHSHLNNATRGFDERNLLSLKMARAAEILSPKFVIVENVPGVARDKHKAWEQLEATLKTIAGGYDSITVTLRAENFGVAQTRRRSFMLAWSRSANPHITGELVQSLVDLQTTPHRALEWVLQGLPQALETNRLFDRPPTLAPQTVERIAQLDKSGSANLPDEFRPDCHRLKEHSYHSVYGRMHAGKPASTMTTGFSVMGRGRFVHPHEPRMLTPHEAARIQFFPDFFDFGVDSTRTEYCRAIGNAVPPKMGFVVAMALLMAEAATS